MKTNPDPRKEDGLLDAVLRDETWQAASVAFKAEALGAFRTRQRMRRLTRWGGGLCVLAVAIAGVMNWLRPARTAAPQIVRHPTVLPKPPERPGYLSDAELLRQFPAGSCFIAEVDGKKELIFFSPELERTYMAKANPPGN